MAVPYTYTYTYAYPFASAGGRRTGTGTGKWEDGRHSRSLTVIPAEAGIQGAGKLRSGWIRAFAGMTDDEGWEGDGSVPFLRTRPEWLAPDIRSMRILIVEDNPRISAFLRKGLEEEGYSVETAADGDEALVIAVEQEFDAAVVDVMLPGRSGIELVRDLRESGRSFPILVLTARDQTEDKIEGLDAGADDYLTKPFDFTELTARIRALLRRSAGVTTPTLRAGGIELDPATREVRRGTEVIALTPKEYALLEYLLRNVNRPLSRATLMEHVWGIRFDPGTNVVDVFINSLRNKLDPERELIQTVRGVGYMIRVGENE